jgi:hypothetical protein
MPRSSKKKFRTVRSEFKKDLTAACESNRALAMLFIETYTAWKHKRHIMQVWELLGFHHQEAYKDYCNKLMGKCLSGRTDIWRSLHFANKELCDKYRFEIPETYAMGDALGIAYRTLREGEK